jgi:uncharacterized protein involved in exopolysaccharide biosynthesis
MEALYLYLLQREESAISLSAAEPKISVIDSADTDNTPVFLKGMIYFGGLVLGLLLPFRVIYGFIRH